MKIFLTEKEVIELAYNALDMNRPDPDKVHDIALRMDMVYNEELDMYEDVEEISLKKYSGRINELQKCLNPAFDIMLKYQDLLGSEPISEQEHALYGDCLKLTKPSSQNCNHDWYDDLSGTVGLRRCRRCPETSDLKFPLSFPL
jgi:hypothetical protein